MEWQPNPDELLALNNGASVYVSYIESDDPPLELSFGTVPDNKAGWHLWKRLFG